MLADPVQYQGVIFDYVKRQFLSRLRKKFFEKAEHTRSM